MAGKIKGITVDIGGDTTGLDKVLSASNKESSALSKELREVEKALKFDPSNVEMLAQKQELLGKSVENAAKKLSDLKEAQAQVEEQFRNGQIGEEAYRAFQREVATAEGELKKAEKAVDDFGNEANGTGQQVDGLNDKVKESSKTADEADGKFQKLGSVLKGVGEAIGATVAAVGAAAVSAGKQLWSMANDVASAGDNIDKTSQKIGISAESYQEWDYVFQRCGASVDNLQSGMKKLSGVIVDAADGSEGAIGKLAAVGLTIDDLNGKSQDEQLSIVISALQNMESGAERTAAANDLLGKSATDMAAVLNMTAEETQALKDEANDYGMIMSNEAVAASAAFEDSLTKMQGTVTGLKNRMVGDLLPGITQIVDGFTDLVAGNENAGDELKNGVTSVIDTVTGMVPQAVTLANTIAGAVMESAPGIVRAMADGIVSAIPELAPAALQMVTGLTGELVAMLPQIVEAGAQILTSIVTGIAQAIPTLIPQTVAVITQIAQTLTDSLPMMLDAALELTKGLAQGILDAIPVLVEALPQLIQSLVDFILGSIPEIIQTGIQLLTALVQALPQIIQSIVSVIPQIIDGIITAVLGALPLIVEAGITLLVALVQALPQITTTITAAIPQIVGGIVDALIGNIDQIILAGVQLFVALVENLPQIIAGIGRAVPQIIAGIVDAVTGSAPLLAEAGLQLIQGLWQGISDAGTWIKDKISGFMDGIVGGIKNFFGIKSPSALMRDQVGRYLAEGIGEGFSEEMENVSREMQRDIPTEFDLAVNTAFGKTLDDDGERSFEIVTPISLGGEKLAKVVSRVQYNTKLNRARVLGVTAQ
ncbi:MAG: phage tail protein [Oscillospiraceae bacterium]|nr:phage tail protein [Oscillospiraceae bacterium]